MNKISSIMLATGALLVLTGCTTLKHNIVEDFYELKNDNPSLGTNLNTSSRLKLTEAGIKSLPYEGSVLNGDIQVFYLAGLEEQATYIAQYISSTISYIESTLSIKNLRKNEIYLIRVDQPPGEFSCTFPKSTSSRLGWPMLVVAGDESVESILAVNYFYPYSFVHEITEISVMDPMLSSPVLTDVKAFPFGWINNHTRWFRDGLANYAMYTIYEKSRNSHPPDSTQNILTPNRRNTIHTSPLSCLSNIKTDIFTWTEYKDARTSTQYYNASLGLFLLIEDRFGQEAIRQIVKQLPTRDYLNGEALISIINETLSTDIELLVSEFQFLDLGISSQELTPTYSANHSLSTNIGLYIWNVDSDSLADKIGLQKGDIIDTINGRRIWTNLDYEVALLSIGKQLKNSMIINRDGTQKTLTW